MASKKFKSPDLTSPRYRYAGVVTTTDKHFRKFIKENPKYKGMTAPEYRRIIELFNKKVIQEVIDNRDGVELPENLGYIFIGSYKLKNNNTVDFKKSKEYGITITHKNWETNGSIAKIIYTNYAAKYKLKEREIWAFEPSRSFSRATSAAFKKDYLKYIVVDNIKYASQLFNKHMVKHSIREQEKITLETYDEFSFD